MNHPLFDSLAFRTGMISVGFFLHITGLTGDFSARKGYNMIKFIVCGIIDRKIFERI